MKPDFLPPPVSGTPIPHGWFARLYQFLLSLIPRGDGNILVDHGPEGVSIRLNPKLLDRPQGGGPPEPGGPQELSVTVSGNTATVAISGSTSHVDFVGTGSVTFTENTNGQVEVNASGGTSGAAGLPYYETGLPSVVTGTVYGPYAYDVWLIGHAGQNGLDGATLTLTINVNLTLVLYDANFGSGSQQSLYVPVFVPIPAGNSFELYGSADFDLRIYQTT